MRTKTHFQENNVVVVVVDIIAVVIVSMNELNLGTIRKGYWAPRN